MKVLCLGNNTEDTDHRTRALCDGEFHGLLSELDRSVSPLDYIRPGWYHSSVYDVEPGRLFNIAQDFDRVIMLDQLKQSWTHPDAFTNTVRLIKRLGSRGNFLDPELHKSITVFQELIRTNPSFCIFPFIELLVNYDHTHVCCRSSIPVTKLEDLKDFATDPGYQAIRNKMLSGEKIAHCSQCYDLESAGLPSARQIETVEWANRLGLEQLDDLIKIKDPVYFEVRASNKCNLQCRMCNPQNSHLIDQEYKKIGLIEHNSPSSIKHVVGFEIVNYDSAQKIYIAGGEPTVMPEFYEFLDRCIEERQTQKEILVNTNGTNINGRFKKQLTHFQNLQFIFSIDGLQDLNYYIRWPSDWDKIIENWKYLRDQGHKVFVNTAISIYNINRLHELFSWIDTEFPNTLIHVQTVSGMLSPFEHPDPESSLQQLEMIRALPCYNNDALFAGSIDGYIGMISKGTINPNLGRFFLFNDKLDVSRQIRLADYCPDLEQFRSQYL